MEIYIIYYLVDYNEVFQIEILQQIRFFTNQDCLAHWESHLSSISRVSHIKGLVPHCGRGNTFHKHHENLQGKCSSVTEQRLFWS